MPVPWKYRRLLEATERFNNFHRFVDMVTVLLFLAIATAIGNKVLPNKILDLPYLQWSWQTITIASIIFIFLFAGQAFYERQTRILSDFQKEAAIKAARKNNFRPPYR
jgi:hypothetical protein